jgi:hypothetical protein
MWLGHGLFQEMGCADDIEARMRICRNLAMDIIFLPMTQPDTHHHLFNYRYFRPDDLTDLVANNESPLVGVIINGPFQQLSERMGLTALLQQWLTPERNEILRAEAAAVSRLVSACAVYKPDLLVIADDIAYNHSTFVNPRDLTPLFASYRDWVRLAHEQGILVLFHSDGTLADVFAELLACGFDGLAGCQLEYLGTALRQGAMSRPWLLAGIPNELLEVEELEDSHKRSFGELLAELTAAGHLVLCSSAGLSSAKNLRNLTILYRWAYEMAQFGKLGR